MNDYYVQALANALLGGMAKGGALAGVQNAMQPSVMDRALANRGYDALMAGAQAAAMPSVLASFAGRNAVPLSTGGSLASRGYPTTANYAQARMPSSPTNDFGYPNTNADAYRYRPGTGRR